MPTDKLPAFQFYPGDWRKDPGVQSLDYFVRGVWFEMLCLMHESEQRGKLMLNGRAMSDDSLARLLGLDNQKSTTMVNLLLEAGVASRCVETGVLMNRRMVRDENLRKIRKECGKLGGNPNLVNLIPTTGVKQKPTPSSSSSFSSSSSDLESARAPKQKLACHVIPPPMDQLLAHGQRIMLSEVQCQAFYDHFESNGWKVGGKAPMRNWQSALQTWKRRQPEFNKGTQNGKTGQHQTSADVRRAAKAAKEYPENLTA